MNNSKVFQLSVAAIVLLLGLHFFTVQGARREIAVDKRTSAAIETLSIAVNSIQDTDGTVPDSIDDLILSVEDKKAIEDTNLKYEKKGNNEYEICAEFNRPSVEPEYGNLFNPFAAPNFGEFDYGFNYSGADPYEHGEGVECFAYDQYGSDSGFDDFYIPQEPEDYEDIDFEEIFSDPSFLEEFEAQVQ